MRAKFFCINKTLQGILMQLNKIPATIVTGFLGSGKTTLLSSLIKNAGDKRIAIIVNEFGELDIDADLLRQCPLECEEDNALANDGIYELANGCICCTVEEEFLPVMQKLVERRDQIDHILIETSGLALPKPLVQAFNWPDVKAYCTVDAVITLIDGKAVAEGRFAHDEAAVQQQRLADENLDHDPSLQELLDDQLSAADLVIVSKSDLLSEPEKKSVKSRITQKVPSAVKTLYIDHGDAPLSLVMGIEAASEQAIESVHTHHDHHHDHGEHHTHAHDHFDSFVIQLGFVDDQRLQQAIEGIVEQYPVFRIKGFAALKDKPMRRVYQVVGKRVVCHFDRLWQSNETPKTQLVVIGKGINEAEIKGHLALAEIH